MSGQNIREINDNDINEQDEHPEEDQNQNFRPREEVSGKSGSYRGHIIAFGRVNAAVIVTLGKEAAMAIATPSTNKPPGELNDLDLVDAVLRVVDQVAANAKDLIAYVDDNLFFPMISAGFAGEPADMLQNTTSVFEQDYLFGQNLLRLQINYF